MSKLPRIGPKVLLVAEHASAVFGGEALIPFQYFKNFREMGLDVHLVVHERTKQELRDSFPYDGERLHFVTDSHLNIWCHKIGRLMPDRLAVFTTGAISHFATQIRQRKLVRRLLRTGGFDIVHEPIPVSPKLPSLLYGLSVPLIIGPMNGGMDYPPNYKTDGWLERFFVFFLRSTAGFWNDVFPGKRQAAVLLVANKRTQDALPARLQSKRIIELVENGVDAMLFRPKPQRVQNGTFQIIHIGRLVDFKRIDLLLKACRQLVGQLDFRLDLVGDGPLRSAHEKQVEQLGLQHYVTFHGWLPQSAAADLLRGADIFVLPSMRECGGAVVLEAMASGIPVIAARWGGPSDYISEDSGILIPPATPDVFVDALGKAMVSLATNPQLRIRMGQAGHQRALECYDWHRKADAVVTIYQHVIASHSVETQASMT